MNEENRRYPQDPEPKTGLYGGNVIIEAEADQKTLKPKLKVNEIATQSDIQNAIDNFRLALKLVYETIQAANIPAAPILEKDKMMTGLDSLKIGQDKLLSEMDKLGKRNR